MTVFLSGLHSGPNPSPGVGTARSLRAAYPDLELVGVDYALGSSGLHWPELNDVWVVPSWSDLDLDAYVEEISDRLDGGSIWLSGLDLETIWLSSTRLPPDQVLVPPGAALRSTKKPAAAAAEALGLRSPQSLPLSAPAPELAAFARIRGWRVWLKGPFYEAQRVGSWSHLLAVRDGMRDVWGTDDLHLQAHVAGLEESVTFAAHQGVLLGACWMTKNAATVEGKTWAGAADEVEAGLLERIREFVATTGWSGGAEAEMVRDPSGELWLLELNPRFPAWIHGATLAGRNLPALLVAAALESPPVGGGRLRPQNQFSRIVVEVPVRQGLRLPPRLEPPTPASGRWASTKHPSGMTVLARLLDRGDTVSASGGRPNGSRPQAAAGTSPTAGDRLVADALDALPQPDVTETPVAVLLDRLATARFEELAAAVADVHAPIEVKAAYSIKTNPDRRLMALARKNGFLAEAISQLEVHSAREVGFEEGDVVLNGPGKWWPPGAATAPVRTVFCDSLTELAALTKRLEAGEPVASVVGVRLRPPTMTSRFGVPTTPWEAFVDLAEAMRQLPSEVNVGIHFHAAESFIGVDRWWASFDAVLRSAVALEDACARPMACFDVGGGWYPEEWDETLLPRLEELAQRVTQALPNCRELVIEPGKALVQPVGAVLTTVLDVHTDGSSVDVVVDAAIAELPDAASHPHRVFRQGSSGWVPVGPGHDRVLGRSCMEHDVLSASVSVPREVAVGETWAIADAGAYDQSMSYRFARGAE